MISSSIKEPIDKKVVEQRVNEWQERLNYLYGQIQQWLPGDVGYEIDTSGSVVMNANPPELMRKYDVPKINLPTMKIIKGKETLLQFEPKGLWVIGANGRVDVHSKVGGYSLVDISERFGREPNWQMTVPFDTQYMVEFTKELFLKMLRASEDA